MNKYILVALTLGLANPSYGASASASAPITSPADAALFATSDITQSDDWLRRQITAGFCLVEEENRELLAFWARPIITRNWPKEKGQEVIVRLNWFLKKIGYYEQTSDSEKKNTVDKLGFILMSGGDRIADLYNTIYPSFLEPRDLPTIVNTLYRHIRKQPKLQEELGEPLRIPCALDYLGKYPALLEGPAAYGFLFPGQYPELFGPAYKAPTDSTPPAAHAPAERDVNDLVLGIVLRRSIEEAAAAVEREPTDPQLERALIVSKADADIKAAYQALETAAEGDSFELAFEQLKAALEHRDSLGK